MPNQHKVLSTARFTLKPMQEADAHFIADLGADPEIAKNLICDWSTPEQRLDIARYWVERNQEYGIWGVFDRDNIFGLPSRFVGFCAADEVLPLGGIGPEIYYAFAKASWGKGVASEAVRAVIEHLLTDQGVPAVEALVLSGLNPGSHRLLEKFGMTLVGRYPFAVYAGEECLPTIRYELRRVESATPEAGRQTLEEAAFKIGQFVADGVVTKAEMTTALTEAAAGGGIARHIGTEVAGSLIEQILTAGTAETGWLHYRVEQGAFLAG